MREPASVAPSKDESELVQLKLNIGAPDGDSTPSEEKRGTPTYKSGGLKKLDKFLLIHYFPCSVNLSLLKLYTTF